MRCAVLTLSRGLRLLRALKPLHLFRRAPRLLCFTLFFQHPIPQSLKSTEKQLQIQTREYNILSKVLGFLRFVLRVLHLSWIWLGFAFKVIILRRDISKCLLTSIEDSGSIFVKLGQWASTRRDLFSPQIIQTLSQLQRNVRTTHSWSHTRKLLSQRFPPNTFESIHPHPIGTGCCAQVYKGILSTSKRAVAIKVRHPGIQDKFHQDLFFLRQICSFMEWLVPDLVWLSSGEFIEDFTESMMKQMDLSLEACNLRKFRLHFKGDHNVLFPMPLDGMCFKDVLVEEFIEGTDIFQIIHGNEESQKRALAKKGVEVFFQMLFQHNFVHGDLHPGNILVTDSGRIAILDPGIVATLSEVDLKNFRSVFKAVIGGDGESVGRLFLERSKHECTDPESFVSDINQIVRHAIRDGELSLGRVDVSKLLNSVFDTFRNHRVKLDSNFSMVIISIIVIEGLGKSLDPDLNLLKSALPYFIGPS